MRQALLLAACFAMTCRVDSKTCWQQKVQNRLTEFCYDPPPAPPPLIGCNGCDCSIAASTKCQQCFDVRTDTNDTSCLTQPARQCLYHDSCTDVKFFETPYINTKRFCCGPPIPGDFGKLPDVNGNAYERLDNGASPVQYRKFDINYAPWVEFDNEESAIFSADNQYTNYTCVNRNCRMALVYRRNSEYDCTDSDAIFHDGSCIVRQQNTRNDSIGLCHNSTHASVCGVWIQSERNWRDIELIMTLIPFNAIIISASVAFGFLWFFKLDNKYSALVPLVWAAALLVMGNMALISAWGMREYAAKTHVDMQYVSYQGCWQYCTRNHGDNANKARRIGCHDRGISCGEESPDDYCKSCQEAKDEHLKLHDASIHLTIATFVRATAFGCVMVSKNINVSFAAIFILVVAWITNLIYLYYSSSGGQREVAKWAVGFGTEPLFSLQVAWTIMGIIECAFCIAVASLELKFKYTPNYVKPPEDLEDPEKTSLLKKNDPAKVIIVRN